MALPLLFAAGMTNLDSVNAWLMQRAYQWGSDHRRRLGFNLLITASSVAVAALVAAIEWTGLVADHVGPTSSLATAISNLPSAGLGLAVMLICVTSWRLARRRRPTELDRRT